MDYTLKLYYDQDLGLDTNGSKIVLWDQNTNTWNELSILDQDVNLQYIKIQGQGSHTYEIVDETFDLKLEKIKLWRGGNHLF